MQSDFIRYSQLIAAANYEDALEFLNESLKRRPNDANTHNNKAWLLSTCPVAEIRNGEEALVHAEKACDLTSYQNYMYVDTLAAVYAEIGMFKDAVRYQEMAVELTPDGNPQKDSIQQRVKLFESGRPFREGPIPPGYVPPPGADEPKPLEEEKTEPPEQQPEPKKA